MICFALEYYTTGIFSFVFNCCWHISKFQIRSDLELVCLADIENHQITSVINIGDLWWETPDYHWAGATAVRGVCASNMPGLINDYGLSACLATESHNWQYPK